MGVQTQMISFPCRVVGLPGILVTHPSVGEKGETLPEETSQSPQLTSLHYYRMGLVLVSFVDGAEKLTFFKQELKTTGRHIVANARNMNPTHNVFFTCCWPGLFLL